MSESELHRMIKEGIRDAFQRAGYSAETEVWLPGGKQRVDVLARMEGRADQMVEIVNGYMSERAFVFLDKTVLPETVRSRIVIGRYCHKCGGPISEKEEEEEEDSRKKMTAEEEEEEIIIAADDGDVISGGFGGV